MGLKGQLKDIGQKKKILPPGGGGWGGWGR